MRLYICWSTGGSDHHDCHRVHAAVTAAGFEPEVIKARGQEHLPSFLQGRARREVHAMTGSYFVPVLVLDDGTAIGSPQEAVDWAAAHAVRA